MRCTTQFVGLMKLLMLMIVMQKKQVSLIGLWVSANEKHHCIELPSFVRFMHSFLILFLSTLIIYFSCEKNNERENFIISPLPFEFPLEKEYAWEYMVEDFNSKADWKENLNPSSVFFDTLFVKPEDSIYSSFWWASNPTYHLLVLNSEDYFLRMGRKNSANGQVLYFATPQVIASFAEPFESFFSNHNYNSFITNRTTCLDTLQDTIVNSYMFISDTINGSIHFYEELKIDQFGIRSKNFFNENIQNSSDILNQYQKVKKVKTLY